THQPLDPAHLLIYDSIRSTSERSQPALGRGGHHVTPCLRPLLCIASLGHTPGEVTKGPAMVKNTKKHQKMSFFEELDTQIGQIDAAWRAENADEAMIRSESLLRTLRNAADDPNSGGLDGLSLG